MSLESINKLPKSTSMELVIKIVEWLGYFSIENNTSIPTLEKSYYWRGDKDFKPSVGIELYIYKK